MSPFFPLPPPGCSIIPRAAASFPGAQRRLSALGVPGRVSSELRWSPGGAGLCPGSPAQPAPGPLRSPGPSGVKGYPSHISPLQPQWGASGCSQLCSQLPNEGQTARGHRNLPGAASPACERGRWTGGDQRDLCLLHPLTHSQVHTPRSVSLHPTPSPLLPTLQGWKQAQVPPAVEARLIPKAEL